MSPCLLNYYFRNRIIKGNQNKLIFDAILTYLKHPLLTEKRMLALLHMLQYFIIYVLLYKLFFFLK